MENIVFQQLIDQDRGEDILRNQINTDNSLRRQFENVFNRPLTAAEQHLLANPPDYSQQEIAADAKALKFQCPILLAFPEIDDIVFWHGHYYSNDALKDMQSHPLRPTGDGSTPTRRNPTTNIPMSEVQFQMAGTALTEPQKNYISSVIADFKTREFRRNEWHLILK